MANKALVIFEQIKRVNEHKIEYWSARELAKVLEYKNYRNFEIVIKKAKKSCKNSLQSIQNHFVEADQMIKVGNSVLRPIKDVLLSRYACYLIMQNADPTKEIVALGQTYFAIQTHRQEVQDQRIENQKRVFLRGEISTHNKHLAVTATKAGVKNYGLFTNYGYKGLYGGLDFKGLRKHKRLKTRQKILDYMGSEELAANLFRATQTDAKINREAIRGEARANQTHFQVGRKIRQTIKDLGGTMPENLPTGENIAKVQRQISLNIRKKLTG